MKKFYVVVAPGPVVVVCNSTPLQTGVPIGTQGYVIEAVDKTEARRLARERFARGEKGDAAAWGEQAK